MKPWVRVVTSVVNVTLVIFLLTIRLRKISGQIVKLSGQDIKMRFNMV